MSIWTPDGKPDYQAIINAFPEHDTGEIMHHTTNGHDFRFHLQRDHNGSYDAVILEQPDYGGRPDGAHETHRLPGPDGFAKICFKTPARDLPTAVTVALWWAECTSRYIRHGGDWK